MAAGQLQTVADLLASPEARVELIDGEIVRRPMALGEHGSVQLGTCVELGPADRTAGPGGWWIATEISVAYEPHQCPSHVGGVGHGPTGSRRSRGRVLVRRSRCRSCHCA